MKLQESPPLHLTYCLNVHPAETWEETFAAVRDHVLPIRDRVAPGGAFGLGLRLSHRAAQTLAAPAKLEQFAGFCRDHGLYVFTINGFPYGRFHGQRVKEGVYDPDWRRPERRDYTRLLADILAALLPEGVSGSISTVPGSYKPWVVGMRDLAQVARMLADIVSHLHRIHERTGKQITLALEPEPDCLMETTEEAIAFLTGPMQKTGGRHLGKFSGLSNGVSERAIRRHLGVCYDTAHAAVQFEDLCGALQRYRDAGVRVAKVQLSAALEVTPAAEQVRQLRDFCEPVYLHQVKVRQADGGIASYADLPAALDAAGGTDAPEQALAGQTWRTHFHVPLFFQEAAGLRSTAHLLGGDFAALLREGVTDHLEIETYTWSVLPAMLAVSNIDDGIIREFQWVRETLGL